MLRKNSVHLESIPDDGGSGLAGLHCISHCFLEISPEVTTTALYVLFHSTGFATPQWITAYQCYQLPAVTVRAWLWQLRFITNASNGSPVTLAFSSITYLSCAAQSWFGCTNELCMRNSCASCEQKSNRTAYKLDWQNNACSYATHLTSIIHHNTLCHMLLSFSKLMSQHAQVSRTLEGCH